MGNIYYSYCVLLSVLAFWRINKNAVYIPLTAYLTHLQLGQIIHLCIFFFYGSLTQDWFNKTLFHYLKKQQQQIIRGMEAAGPGLELTLIDFLPFPIRVFSWCWHGRSNLTKKPRSGKRKETSDSWYSNLFGIFCLKKFHTLLHS